jgi:hypothetical protein
MYDLLIRNGDVIDGAAGPEGKPAPRRPGLTSQSAAIA